VNLWQTVEGSYDRLEQSWESPRVNRLFSTLLVVSFLGTLVLVEVGRVGLIPFVELPRSHFAAINVAFTLILVAEVLSLVFALPDSVSDSVGKQFELLSLVLLRKAFLEFSELGEPIAWEGLTDELLVILSDATGALLIYVLVALFFRIQAHRPITRSDEEQTGFVRAKKAVALTLLLAFAALAVDDVRRSLMGEPYPFFEAFYLVLIFGDILLVLISYRYSHNYHVVFRNSGFALSAVFIRLSLSAPPYVNAALGVFSVLFALGVTWSYGRFYGGVEGLEPPGPGHGGSESSREHGEEGDPSDR
jgi:hypothetical protein